MVAIGDGEASLGECESEVGGGATGLLDVCLEEVDLHGTLSGQARKIESARKTSAGGPARLMSSMIALAVTLGHSRTAAS